MTDISNILIAAGIIISFLYFVRLSIKAAAKEEVSLLATKIELNEKIESIDRHIKVLGENTVTLIDQKFEEYFPNKNNK